VALLHRQPSWFTAFAAPCKPANLMELLLPEQKFKPLSPPVPVFSPKAQLSRSLGLLSMLVAISALSACNTSKTFGDLTPGETLTQGYIVDQESLDLVPVGSSREQVLLALGTPSTTATFDNEVFYYISQTRKRAVAFAKPKLVDQKVLAVYFGPDNRVTRIANYGLKDGKVFDFISRTTPTGGKDQNFLIQVIKGAGSYTPSVPGTGM
jgi:outer membrane protein assembly factor BamE (lipoprotein component of BamABCDE complex)